VGPSNELSHAACLRVISSPAVSYNPLFVHGDSGLGKTHLLQATCRGLLERHSSHRVLYISCEEFMNRFVEALNRRSLPAFRRELRHVDCLAIDDVHFLSKKKRMQEEFFHTFNALYDARKQIVLSSDSKPRDMSDFEDRLLTRFQWGLMTSIDPPTHETRRQIVDRKARAHDKILPGEVAQFVADLAHRNVRELEGAVVKLVATANLEEREIDLGFAREALSDLVSNPARPPSLAELASEVASRFGVSVTDLKSSGRSRSILVPRQVGMYLSKRLTHASLSEIGAFYGGRDHSTVLNSLKRAESLMISDNRVNETVKRVTGRYHRSDSL
jgi:chromosomal replication initiator protein